MQTRSRLLDSAREVFALRGFAAASVDEIAERAGYSKGAVYSNFATKEELFLELLKGRMAEELAELEAMLDTGASAPDLLTTLKKKYATIDKQVVWCVLSLEFEMHAIRNRETAPEFSNSYTALYRHQRSAVARLVKSLAERAGTQVPANAQEIATALMALLHGIAAQRAADPEAVAAATAGKAIETYLSAVLKSPKGL